MVSGDMLCPDCGLRFNPRGLTDCPDCHNRPRDDERGDRGRGFCVGYDHEDEERDYDSL